jgi:NitT/TauT family transport system substrate-binding protein
MSRRRDARRPAATRIAIPRCLVLLWLCCGLAIPATADELVPARIGLTRDASAAPLLVAVAAGYFKAEGLDPQITFLATDAAVSAAVATGKLDFGMASLSAPFYRFAAAHGIKMIASRSSDQTGFPMDALLISSRARAAGFSDVRGLPHERIGIPSSDSGAAYALFSIAARFGLDFGSIKTIGLASTDAALKALFRGDIDAALLPYPTAIHSARRSQSLLLVSNFTGWQQGAAFTTGATIATRRDLTERFMRAYQHGTAEYHFNFLEYDDAGDFIHGPRFEDYLSSIARQLHLSPDFLAVTKIYCDRRANLDAADIERQVRFWQDQGRLDKRIAAADLIDLSFIGEEGVAP